jgi:DNA-directed RNA polymerase II subunit RPB2
MEEISWKIIDTYFKENPNNLVAHHIESYNDFFFSEGNQGNAGINRIFRENNPIRFIERGDDEEPKNECNLYLGGKDGTKIYFGKPIIYDENENFTHYMYPNDARLRNMTYGITIHYDVDVDFTYNVGENNVKVEKSKVLEKIYLVKFPIMLQSKLCILNGLDRNTRFTMGECRNDYGGYFIIDGKEKTIICQEKFADNMLYIRDYQDKDEHYTHSAEIRSLSEDTSKPIRTTSVKIVKPSPSLTNKQIVVDVPNVRKPVPLFILMRALGIISDKDIIQTCLLVDPTTTDSSFVDLFVPSIHDANKIFTQQLALEYIASFTKRQTISDVMLILSDYFLPHVGELNFIEKAYFLGFMVYKLLKVVTKEEKPTDRDNFRFKRIELTGTLLYNLFREYYLIQKRTITRNIDTEYYFHRGKYKETEAKAEMEGGAPKKKTKIQTNLIFFMIDP